ncbi:MAG TPA: hypothetical protein VIF10_10325 [Methylobacter sp.]|jgi:hypothetical protein
MSKYIADCLQVRRSKPVLPNLSVPAKSGKPDESNFWWGWVSQLVNYFHAENDALSAWGE